MDVAQSSTSASGIFYGAVVNPMTLTKYAALPRCLISVGPSGNVDWVEDDVPEHMLQETLAKHGLVDAYIHVVPSDEFIMPGFIDTHTHAPQFPNAGSGQQYELLDWLNNVTFPTEAKFSNIDYAQRSYESVVERVISFGTTTCCYYGTRHLEATKVLADIVHRSGQRAFIGKCNMDRNCPENYIDESVESSIAETKDLIAHIRSLPRTSSGKTHPHPLVQPILTPRFAISCTSELLASLGKVASDEPSLHIQTHISENKSEVAFTKQLFPGCPNYASVYDSFGLLRSNTVLAHAVHLEKDEVELIARRGAGISHCPTSNFNLSSGVAPIGEYLDRGIKVGLGTDVSGGFSMSILNTIQNASIAAKVISMQPKPQATLNDVKLSKFAGRQLSVATLLYLATLGGAEVCAIDSQVGSFAPGKSFDALFVGLGHRSMNPGVWSAVHDEGIRNAGDIDRLLEKFMFCGDDRNIARVYVQGRLIGGTRSHG